VDLEAIDSLDEHFCVIPCLIPTVPLLPLSPDNWSLQLPPFTPRSEIPTADSKVVIVCIQDKASDFYGIAADDNQYAADIHFPGGASIPATAGPNTGALVTNLNQDQADGCIPFCEDKCFVGQVTSELGPNWWSVEIAEDQLSVKYEPVLVKILASQTGGGFYSAAMYSCDWGDVDKETDLAIAATNPTGPVRQDDDGVTCTCIVLNTTENGRTSHILIKDEFYMGVIVSSMAGVKVVAVSVPYSIKFLYVDQVYAEDAATTQWANFATHGFQSWCTGHSVTSNGTLIEAIRVITVKLTHKPLLASIAPFSGYLTIRAGDTIGYLSGDRSAQTADGRGIDGYIVEGAGGNSGGPGVSGPKMIDLNCVFPVVCQLTGGVAGSDTVDCSWTYSLYLNCGAAVDLVNVIATAKSPERARLPRIEYEISDGNVTSAPGLARIDDTGAFVLVDVLTERPVLDECDSEPPLSS